jgi:hypothetical protein
VVADIGTHLVAVGNVRLFMIQRNPPQDDRKLLTGIGVAVLLLLFFAVLHGFVVVETYELAAFEAHRSCTQRGVRSCDSLLPPWHAEEREQRTLRARFAALVGRLPDLTLDAADAAKDAASEAFDALTITAEAENT